MHLPLVIQLLLPLLEQELLGLIETGLGRGASHAVPLQLRSKLGDLGLDGARLIGGPLRRSLGGDHTLPFRLQLPAQLAVGDLQLDDPLIALTNLGHERRGEKLHLRPFHTQRGAQRSCRVIIACEVGHQEGEAAPLRVVQIGWRLTACDGGGSGGRGRDVDACRVTCRRGRKERLAALRSP